MENEILAIVESAKKNESGFPTRLITAPKDKISSNELMLHLLHVESKDVTLKWVFDHVRNYMICGAVLWAGTKGFRLPSNDVIDWFVYRAGGSVLLVAAILLFALNMAHGIVGFSKIKNLGAIGKITYLICTMLLFFAAQVLFVTAKSS